MRLLVEGVPEDFTSLFNLYSNNQRRVRAYDDFSPELSTRKVRQGCAVSLFFGFCFCRLENGTIAICVQSTDCCSLVRTSDDLTSGMPPDIRSLRVTRESRSNTTQLTSTDEAVYKSTGGTGTLFDSDHSLLCTKCMCFAGLSKRTAQCRLDCNELFDVTHLLVF